MTNAFERLPKSWRVALIVLYGTLVAAFVAFVVYRRQALVEGVIDLNGFGAVARNLAHGDGFSLGHGPTVRRAPVYPFFGAALLKLFGTTNATVPAELFRPLLIANCVIMGVTCLVVWRLASELFGSGTGLLAAIICPLVPQSLRYVGMTEIREMLGGVNRHHAYQISTGDGFPEPVSRLHQGRVWDAAEVRAWMNEHRRRPFQQRLSSTDQN
jgi:predicted DNA-binding transcriptional regulator AlpA